MPLRIIAGELKGRRLRTLAGLRTRPTAERTREAIFNILGPAVRSAHLLDLFAGTGAYGIEGLSRGADSAVFVEVDLVSHSGDRADGEFIHTLTFTDIHSTWTETRAVMGKSQAFVKEALDDIRDKLPFPRRGIDSDNGSEFINHLLYPYCQRQAIKLTRGRPYKKNDQAYVEQRNWFVVRKTVGYDRYASKAALAALAEVYEPLRLYMNFFQPLRKVVSKERVGAKVRKRYDTARTPYRRLLDAGVLNEGGQERLRQLYLSLNPVNLRAEIDAALERLWRVAERGPASKVAQTGACG